MKGISLIFYGFISISRSAYYKHSKADLQQNTIRLCFLIGKVPEQSVKTDPSIKVNREGLRTAKPIFPVFRNFMVQNVDKYAVLPKLYRYLCYMARIIFLVVFCVLGVGLFYYSFTRPKEEVLPIYNPVDLDPDVVDPEMLRIGRGHKIGTFSFLNQNGKKITDKDVEGNVYVVEYFFTTCGTICPVMNKQLQRVQESHASKKDFKILSFTVDPETDDVAQMKHYSSLHHADDSQWWFLTGEKNKLYELARKSFFVLKPAEAQNLGDAGSDFIHTNNFVLVDRKMRIRGYYDGTSEKEVDKLIKDIDILLKEQ